MLTTTLLASFGLFYLVDTLLLRKRETHEGPFVDEDKRVCFYHEKDGNDEVNPHFQRLSAFDKIRGFFGVYTKGENLWYVNPGWRTEVWTCPKCLSMWLGVVFSVPYLVANQNVGEFALFHVAIVGMAVILSGVYEYLTSAESEIKFEPTIIIGGFEFDDDDDIDFIDEDI